MNVTVTKATEVTRTVSVEIPAEVVDKTFDKVVRKLAQRVQLPGSYTKLPAKIARVRMMMKKEIQEEVGSTLMDDTAMEALNSQGLEALGNPVAEESPAAVEHQPYTYVLTVEVAPTFETLDYKGLQIPEMVVEVKDADIDAALEKLVGQSSRLVDANEVPIADEFYVEVSAHLTDAAARETHKLKEWEDKYFKMNDEAPAALQKALIGFKTGETLSITASVHDVLHFQDHKHAEDEAGSSERYAWQVKVKSVRQWQRPEVNDAFAKEARNLETVAALRDQLREEQTKEKGNEAQSTVRKAIADQLSERNPFELPSRLVASLYQRRVQEITDRLKQYKRAFDPETMKRLEERERTQALFGLIEESRMFFLMKALAKLENIAVTEEDVQAWAQRTAAERGVEASFVLGKLNEEQRADLEAYLLDEKIFQVLIENGVKRPYDEYMAERKVKEEEAREKFEADQAARDAAAAPAETPAATVDDSPAS